MTSTHTCAVGIRKVWPAGLALALALFGLVGCVHHAPTPPDSVTGTPAVSSKISPLLETVARQLASGKSASDFSHGPVRADAQGRLQVYVYVSDLTPASQAALADHGLDDQLPSPPLHLVQGWVLPSNLEALAQLPFVTRITPPQYAHTR